MPALRALPQGGSLGEGSDIREGASVNGGGTEGQSIAEQLSHSANRQKGMSRNFALLVVSVVKCLPIICSTGDGAWPFLGSHQPTSRGEGESIGEG